MFLIILMFLVVVALNALDVWTTEKVLSQGGRELNKPFAYLMQKVGVLPALVLVKLVMFPVLLLVIIYLPNDYWRIPMLTYWIGFYSWVVWHNWNQIKPAA